MKTFWLSKKAGKRAALLPIPKADRSEVQFRLLQEPDFSRPEQIIEKFPILKEWEIDAGHLVAFLNGGTMNSAGVWSPLSGRPGMIALTMDDLRRQGQQGLLGAQMTCVVTEATRPDSKRTFKRYRLPNEEDLQAAQVEIEDLEDAFADIPFGIPDEPTPTGGGSGASRAFSLHRYGLKKWRELFTNRQLLALSSFVRHTRSATSLIAKEDQKLAEAVGAYLAICMDRLVDYSSAHCTWTSGRDKIRNTFGRFALPMVWDFCEVNPLSDSTGNFLGALEWVSLFIDHALEACSHSGAPFRAHRVGVEEARRARRPGSDGPAVLQRNSLFGLDGLLLCMAPANLIWSFSRDRSSISCGAIAKMESRRERWRIDRRRVAIRW